MNASTAQPIFSTVRKRWRLVAGGIPLLVLVLLAAALEKHPEDRIQIKTDFPGGAAVLKAIEVDDSSKTTVIKVDIPSTLETGWRIWWNFKLQGLRPGELIRIEADPGRPATLPGRAVWSCNGRLWRFLDKSYQVRVEGREAWFAWSVPYVSTQVNDLIDTVLCECDEASRFHLATSRKGKDVYGIRFSSRSEDSEKKPVIWIQARQHAWETGSSWVVDGFVRWLISGDVQAKDLIANYDIYVIPIVDIDSVEAGLGGKNRKPFDHNRDYTSNPSVFPEVAAIKNQLLTMKNSGRELAVFFDVHNPGWKGAYSDFYLIYSEPLSKPQKERVTRFSKTQSSFKIYPMTISDRGDVKEAGLRGASGWALRTFSETVLSLTPEIPVAPPHGFRGYPPEHHQTVGEEMGRGLFQYLNSE